MFWLQTPPWSRWILSGLLVAFAVWLEFRPAASVDHPFATETISVGEAITPSNTEMLSIRQGLIDPVSLDSVASSRVEAGNPVLRSDVEASSNAVPTDWWIVSADVPFGSVRGERARVVLLDTGQVVEAVIAAETTDDPFAATLGAVAVPSSSASDVAIAVATGRAAVLISAG